MKTILRYLEKEEIKFSDGGLLTPDRFLELGIIIGMRGKSQSQMRPQVRRLTIIGTGGLDVVHGMFIDN